MTTTRKNAEDYNGWANRATWNVALWIGNDEGYYHAARELALRVQNKGRHLGGVAAKYFVTVQLGWDRTPDGIGLSRVRWGEIATMLRELAGEEDK